MLRPAEAAATQPEEPARVSKGRSTEADARPARVDHRARSVREQATAAKPTVAHARRRMRIALTLGAALGFSLAGGAILEKRQAVGIPDDAVATVNGNPIRSEDLTLALNALSADRRDPIGDSERRQVLDRLIDEELLLQRARQLGVDRHDRGVRSRLVSTMLEAILAEQGRAEPTTEEVAEFYRDNAAFFAGDDHVWVRDLRVAISEGRPEARAREVAELAASRLRGGADFAIVAHEHGDAPVAVLADAPLPAAKLRDYLGPALTARAMAMSAGDVSAPLLETSAFHVLQVVEREPGAVPPLASIENDVVAEMRRRADDRAVRAYLEDLRKQAAIRTREP